jgi:TorA-specific chaperone
MNAALTLSENQKSALLEGIHRICGLFWGPNPDMCRDLASGIYLRPLVDINSFVTYDPPDALQKIRSEINKNQDAAASLFSDLEALYIRLFINNKEGAITPLYESCYPENQSDEAALMGEAAIKMKQRFESKGLTLSNDLHEPPDHLSIELEYLYFLLEKGWADNNKALVDEAASFTAETMLPWTTRLQQRLSAEKEGHLYSFLASILKSILQVIAEWNHCANMS